MHGLVDVGDAKLHAVLHGSGPSLLFISGATGDADEWAGVAPELAEEFTVITFDRRGMSRSPRPDGWTATSMTEQAEDAAGLLRALQLAPAVVVGHSAGGSIACELVASHPSLVRQAMIYEPPLLAAIDGGDQAAAALLAHVEPVLAARGPRAAMEVFMRSNVPGEVVDQVLTGMGVGDRDRVLGNGAVFLPMELTMFLRWVPDLARMRTTQVPITVLVGEESLCDWPGATSRWLADGLSAPLVPLPGGHVAFVTHPHEFATVIARIARTV